MEEGKKSNTFGAALQRGEGKEERKWEDPPKSAGGKKCRPKEQGMMVSWILPSTSSLLKRGQKSVKIGEEKMNQNT